MAGIGPTELIIVAVLALLILGPKRLPSAGRAIGHGLREFKSAVTGETRDEPELPAVARPTDAV